MIRFPNLHINRQWNGGAGITPQDLFATDLQLLLKSGTNTITDVEAKFVTQLSDSFPTYAKGWHDYSKSLVFESNIYTSNFTASVDGMLSAEGTLTFDETTDGSDGWLKFVQNANVAQHFVNQNFGIVQGGTYRVMYDIFIESGLDADGHHCMDHGGLDMEKV